MTITLDIDKRDLLKWAHLLQNKRKETRTIVAKSLNAVGRRTLDHLTRELATSLDVSEANARGAISSKEATRNNLTYEILLNQEYFKETRRQLPGRRQFRRRPEDYFHAGELVNVVTMEDERVCVSCQEIAEHNPYTIEDARAQIPHHPHCRCLLVPYRDQRTLPVAFRQTSKPARSAALEDMTVRQIADTVVQELGVLIKSTMT